MLFMLLLLLLLPTLLAHFDAQDFGAVVVVALLAHFDALDFGAVVVVAINTFGTFGGFGFWCFIVLYFLSTATAVHF
jgi:hypothetical protein